MTPTPSIPPDRTPPTLSREEIRDIQQRPMLPDQGFGFGLATMTPQERESLCSLALSALEAREAATKTLREQHPTCGACRHWEFERLRYTGTLVAIASEPDMGFCRCAGAVTENVRTPVEFYCPLQEPQPTPEVPR